MNIEFLISLLVNYNGLNVGMFASHRERDILFFFLDSRKPHPRKVYFVGLDERVKSQLSHALTKDARPDSNSRPAIQS